VAQAAVIGVPDERMGEVGCAYIVPTPECRQCLDDPREAEMFGRDILRWARDQMANYKVPRSVVVVDALPVNAGGKVLKRELRERRRAGEDHVVTNERSG
jgi:acyl-CoA synthetase (AMP-forming)/AMP-acid ligase II